MYLATVYVDSDKGEGCQPATYSLHSTHPFHTPSDTAMPLVLITGFPGVGKTTVAQAVARAVTTALAKTGSDQRVAGFITEELVAETAEVVDTGDGGADGGGGAGPAKTDGARKERVGFDVVNLETGDRAPLARLLDKAARPPQRGPRMGKWVVNSDAFGKLAGVSLAREATVYIVDEIGKMELFSRKFVDRTRELCAWGAADSCFVIATVASKGTGFISEVKDMELARVIDVAAATRDELPNTLTDEVLAWCAAHPKARPGAAQAAQAALPRAMPAAAPAAGGGGSKTVQASLCLIPDGALWPGIQAIREQHDTHLVRWMPHINLLYPFVHLDDFDAAAERLAEGLQTIAPFELRFDKLGVFHHSKKSHTFWLDPQTVKADAGCPLDALYSRLVDLFPNCNDTNTKSEAGFRPHLSLGQVKGNPPNMAEMAALWPGGGYTVSHVHLIYRSDFHDPFHVRRAVALGDPAGSGRAIDWKYTAGAEGYWTEVHTGKLSNDVPNGSDS